MRNNKVFVVTVIGTAQLLAWGSTFFLPAILADSINAELKLGISFTYASLSGALILSALLSPYVGRTIDLYGGRMVLSLSSLAFAVGLAIIGISGNTHTFVIGWVFIGIGMSMGLYDTAFSALAFIYGKNSRVAMTCVTLIGGLTSLVCWPLSAWMEIEIGWRGTCLVWAASHLLIGLPLHLLLPSAGKRAEETHQNKSSLVQEMEETVNALNDRLVMALVALMFVFVALTAAGTSTNLPHLIESAGLDTASAIAAAALFGPAQILGRALDLYLSRRRHPFYAVRLAFVFHPLGVIAILIFGAPAAAIFVILHGIGNGILTTAMGTVPLVLFGSKGYGWRQGLMTIPRRIGMAVSPFVFAVVLERMGMSVLLLTSLSCIFGLVTLLVITHFRSIEGDVRLQNEPGWKKT